MSNSPRSSKRSAPSLRIEPRPSRIGRAALVLMAALALLALTQSALPPIPMLVAALLVAAVAWHGGKQVSASPIVAAALQADGGWLLATREGEQMARLVEYSLLAGAIGLGFTSADGNRHWRWMVWPDALPPDQDRRLRVWLRSSRAEAARGRGLGPEGMEPGDKD